MPPVVKSGNQDEGQAGPDPGIQDKGQAKPNPDDVAESQPLSTPRVHAGPNLEHTDAKATDATSQPQPGEMDEDFGDQFFNDKPSEADNEKTTADIEAESMVSVTIHYDNYSSTTSATTTSTRFLRFHLNQPLRRTRTTYRGFGGCEPSPGGKIRQTWVQTDRLENQDILNQVNKAVDEIVTNAVDWAMQAPLRKRFRDLV
ncbi:hypothetical protein Tco_1552933 [Tanacetum coccineum]